MFMIELRRILKRNSFCVLVSAGAGGFGSPQFSKANKNAFRASTLRRGSHVGPLFAHARYRVYYGINRMKLLWVCH
jgi:hypothetical protein